MLEESLSRQFVVFSLGEEEYALPIGQVHEIIRYTAPRSVASADPSVRGVISLRGKILPVYDLAVRLGIAHADVVDDAKIVIVEAAQDMAGVVVDDVEEVVTLAAEQLDEAPVAGGRCIEGIAKIGDRLVVLLDPQEIVGSEADLAVAELDAESPEELAAAA